MRIGVDLGGTKIEAIALDRNGAQLARERTATPQHDYDSTIRAISTLVNAFDARFAQRGTVGVGIPGTISPATGLVKNANSVWLNGRALDKDLEAALTRPVRLANDANCFALSEAVDGAGSGASVVFGVILGTGVGGGVVVDRTAMRGRNAIGGEWGHNPLPWSLEHEQPGEQCWCGKFGCIESWLSGPSLMRELERRLGERVTVETAVARTASGDHHCGTALADYEHRLARALASIVNVIDPDVVVLGGGLSNLPNLAANVEARLGEWTFSDRINTPVRRNVHGDSSGVRGAAWLWPNEP